MGWFLNQNLCLLALALLVVLTSQKPINVALSGKWRSTPLLLETSEFLAKESNDNFWTFVSHIAIQDAQFFETASDEVKYMFALKHASDMLSPLQLSFLKFSLSLRAFSPTIQMYQQLAEQSGFTANCTAFVEVNGEFTCDLRHLDELISSADQRSVSSLYQFDHLYSKTGGKDVVVVLNAELGSREFRDFHHHIVNLAKAGDITYCLRHFVKSLPDENVRLSGYGVELAIKSTEYKAKDDTKVEDGKKGKVDDDEEDGVTIDGIDFAKVRARFPELKSELRDFRNSLVDTATEITPFKVWQLQDLSCQAGQKIVSADPDNALQLLRDISQNFPTQARSLLRTVVSNDFKREVQKNQEEFSSNGVNVGESLMYLNGLSVDMDIYDVFTLLDVMTSEASLVEGLHSLGLKGDALQKFLQLDLKEGGDASYALDIRHSAVQYLNDLSVDKRYRTWPNSVQDLLRPTFPGMLRHLAKNIFHLVFVIDPTTTDSKTLLKMAEAFYVHKAPFRLGIAFSTNPDINVNGYSDAGVALARAFNFVSLDQKSPSKALSFITDVYEKLGSGQLTADVVIAEFASQHPGEDKEMVFGDNDDYDDVRKSGLDFVSRAGLTDLPQVLINGVPLEKQYVGTDSFEEGVVMEVLKQTQTIQAAVYKGEVSDQTDLLEWWMERDNVLPRLNSRVLAAATSHLDFTGNFGNDLQLTPTIAKELDSKTLTSAISDRLVYLTRKEEKSLRSVSQWVICDLETAEGREHLYNAIKHVKTSNDLRVGIVFNPTDVDADNSINKAVQVALSTLPPAIAKSLVTKLVKEENVEGLRSGKKAMQDLTVHGMDMDAYEEALKKESGTFLQLHRMFAKRVLSLKEGQRGVVTNGAILGPISPEEELSVEDFGLLEKLASQQAGKKVKEAIADLSHTDVTNRDSELLMKVSGLLMSRGKKETRQKVSFAGDQHSVIKIPANPKAPAFTVEAIVDPASREAQKMAPILMILKEIVNVDIRIYLNPRDKLSEMPLTSFYRYVLEPEVKFDADGELTSGPSALFLDMPQKSLLTLAMNTPEAWLVEPVTSPYDLDNILLEEVEKSVIAGFELEYILLEGHCHDSSSMQPPRGLQFVLGTDSEPETVDTIVMANLGYFQLKANPGLWQLSLREGRSRDIYDIESHENTDTPSNAKDVVIAINTFKSKIIKLKVSKKPDKKNVNLLQDEESQGGLWDSISSTITGSSKKNEEEEDSTLNIFSLASGHLYERFLRIMMLSVLKNTKSKVKFWFLKNFLSPSFKDFIPYMAQEYGFEYELVQYKWPRWLNQQKEKQRIIWGYKILFLDVLFPLDVKKIIFVDADQIVRADMQELHDLDLGGAPYGYTPFCESRKEMEGFRFWNSGYWRSHLAGRKYHISALYVVDLKKFRRIAAGDRLRGQYQGLSQDPNSLSNLDQDLPNNMIHQVAIKSLPQEWLYCETWCSEHEKARAKTIDLCNNPLTKEPKLQAAMRIVPEWKDYDYEIKVLWDEIYQTNTKEQIEYEPPKKHSRAHEEL